MALYKLKKSFNPTNYSDSKLLVFTLSVVGKMTGNSYFTNPNPKLKTIKTSYNEFQFKIAGVWYKTAPISIRIAPVLIKILSVKL